MMKPKPMPTRVEMLKGIITMTETGFPASYDVVREGWKTAHPAPEEGWWWIPATPRSAASIREHGHHRIGTLTTIWIPPQEAPVVPMTLRPGEEER